MRIGFTTRYTPETVEFAAEAGFDCLELNSSGAGPICDATATDDEAKQVRELLDKKGIACPNYFFYHDFGDPEKGLDWLALFPRACEIATILGADIVCINAYVPFEMPVDEQLAWCKQHYGKMCKQAEAAGKLIAIENCPHGLHSIAYSPMMWKRLFNEVDSEVLGLEFDPSHLVFQYIDYIAALYEFGEKVFTFHAKDTEIMDEVLAWEGNLTSTWWRFRIPGYGDVDWNLFFRGLADIGYIGDLIIEHEDPVFHGERHEEGLRLGLKFLRSFVLD